MEPVKVKDMVNQEIQVTFKFRLMKATRLHQAWMLRGIDSNGEPVAVHILDKDVCEVRSTD